MGKFDYARLAVTLLSPGSGYCSKLREITQIKSPVSGRIRRIKNLGQKDRQINLEVVIDISDRQS